MPKDFSFEIFRKLLFLMFRKQKKIIVKHTLHWINILSMKSGGGKFCHFSKSISVK